MLYYITLHYIMFHYIILNYIILYFRKYIYYYVYNIIFCYFSFILQINIMCIYIYIYCVRVVRNRNWCATEIKIFLELAASLTTSNDSPCRCPRPRCHSGKTTTYSDGQRVEEHIQIKPFWRFSGMVWYKSHSLKKEHWRKHKPKGRWHTWTSPIQRYKIVQNLLFTAK